MADHLSGSGAFKMSGAPVIPVNLQVPADPSAPIIADFAVHALRVAIVQRQDLERVPADWVVPGIYVLVGSPGPDDRRLPLYVGKARDLRKRLFQHRTKPKLEWRRAIAVKRDTTHGFNSSEIGYLEGRLAAELCSLPGAHVIEGQRDQDTTLPEHHLLALDAFVPSVFAALRIAGLDLSPADTPLEEANGDADSPGERRRSTAVPGTVADLLAAGLLSAGATLTFARAGKRAQARVAASGELIVNGVTYASPSTAAAKAFGLRAANGWVSWRLEDGRGASLADLRAQLPGAGPDGAL